MAIGQSIAYKFCMVFTVFTLFLLLICCLLLPAKYFDNFITTIENIHEAYLLKSSTYRARLLINQLSMVSKRMTIGHFEIPELVTYKFYNLLIYKVMDYHRTFGGPIREVLAELRGSLISDYRTEVEVVKVRNSSRMQMILTSMIIWAFTFFALSMLDLKLGVGELWPIFVLQLLGFLFEYSVLKSIGRRKLEPFERLMESIYFFNLLNFSGNSLSSSVKQSNIYLALGELPSKHQYFQQDFEYILENWKSFGGSLKTEFKLFNEEVRFTFDGQLADFKSTCSVVQFITMALFYFPCFFILMGLIMQHISLA